MSSGALTANQRRSELRLHMEVRRLGGRTDYFFDGSLASNLALHLLLQPEFCQTCGKPTVLNVRGSPPGSDRWNRARTRGHLCPIRLSGSEYRHWINQCQKCNIDQGDKSFFAWLEELREDRDPRVGQMFKTFIAMLELGIPLGQIDVGIWVRRLPRRPVCDIPRQQAAE